MPIGQFPLEFHTICEFLAIGLGFRLYLARSKGRSSLPENKRYPLIAGALLGALIGAKAVVALNHPEIWNSGCLDLLASGKGLVGALVFGWLFVELAKLLTGIKEKTGDTFVEPLLLGICLGRIGCFLSGKFDQTYGIASPDINLLGKTINLGVDFGDGVLRHPCQLYEIAALLIFWLWLAMNRNIPLFSEAGMQFRCFMLYYMAFRFCIDFFKPVPHLYCGLNAEQIFCLPVVIICLGSIIWKLAGPPAKKFMRS